MKKTIYFGLVFIVGCNLQSIAGTGGAYDGLNFLFVILGFLLIILGYFLLFDIIKRNGNKILNKTIEIYRWGINLIRHFFKNLNSNVFHHQYQNQLNFNDTSNCSPAKRSL